MLTIINVKMETGCKSLLLSNMECLFETCRYCDGHYLNIDCMLWYEAGVTAAAHVSFCLLLPAAGGRTLQLQAGRMNGRTTAW